MQGFRIWQSALPGVISGLGLGNVVAPVRCTRNVTSCTLCDSADGFSCVHALRSRSVRRGQPSAARGHAGPGKDDVGESGAHSKLPIALYKCPPLCEREQRDVRAAAAWYRGLHQGAAFMPRVQAGTREEIY